MGKFLAVVVFILGFVGLMWIFGSFTVVGAAERGVITRFGKVSDTVLEPGFHGKSYWDNIHKMDVKTRTIEFGGGTKLLAASKDLQDVKIEVVVNWHLNPAQVKQIYKQYNSVENFEAQVLSPSVRESVKSLSASYTAEELVTKRQEFSDKVNSDLATKFLSKDAIMESFKVTNFEFSDSFNNAIEAKVTAEQNAQAAKNKLEQVKYEAQQAVEKAKAEAEAIKIQASAITQQGGADYVQLQAIKQWDGKLPSQMVPGSTVPFLQLSK